MNLPSDDELIGRFLSYLLAEKRYSEYTIRNYQTALNSFLAFIRTECSYDETLEAIPEQLIRSYIIEEQRRGISRRTLHLRASSCRSFYQYLRAKKIINKNPFQGIKLPQFKKPLPKFLTEKQMVDLLAEPKKLFKEKKITEYEFFRDQLIFELLYGAGLRISELISLQWNHYEESRRIFKIRGKGNKERLCPIGKAADHVLSLYQKLFHQGADPESKILKHENGKTITAGWVQKRMKVYLNLAGLPQDLTPHKIRHSYATHLLNGGADLRLVQELLGHSSLTTTQVYTHVGLERLKSIHTDSHPRA